MTSSSPEVYLSHLLGGAVGDGMGLPFEGLRPERVVRCRPHRPRFLFGRSMVSDDTEHTWFVAQCLLASSDDEMFRRRLGWCVRGWILGAPAGVGWATLRAALRLWGGVPPTRSGVFSAGNGPAMRSGIIGVRFFDEPERLEAMVIASTELTHRDPVALVGARIVAHLSAWIVGERPRVRPSVDWLVEFLRKLSGDNAEWEKWIDRLESALREKQSAAEFGAESGLADGVSGYMVHTVIVVCLSWHVHFGDYRSTIESLLDAGGDTDTTAAIAGGLQGLVVGAEGIPAEWRRWWEYPRGEEKWRELSVALAERHGRPVRYFWPAIPFRNFVFLGAVLTHAVRRALT